ncbi:hypothetical protein S7335_392 [Synechococcus sp. PCC 7335]|uniref:hypothetical protein n=1 Tax=Synechococcus sp. (strain ATCC 29403 / PCC 7335) TaxID=91464 RepID=UPI00017EC80C|nr:hypothetical protein [Synechococcus sp. PCC 7335]EDX83213.1 hypothetical protein S7335_392 [Synechococcus sp. PCC 7335]
MSSNQSAVINAIAVLLSTTPEHPLGKLLNVCLMAKVDGDVKAKATEFFDDPTRVAYWVQEVIGSDEKYTPEECMALGNMELMDVDGFASELMKEIETLSLE